MIQLNDRPSAQTSPANIPFYCSAASIFEIIFVIWIPPVMAALVVY